MKENISKTNKMDSNNNPDLNKPENIELRYKSVRVIFILLMLLSVIIPLIFTDRTIGVVSHMDNTKLVDLDLTDGVKPSNIDKYLQERIGFREKLMGFYGNINNKIFGKLEHPLYTYGLDGEVYLQFKEEKVDKEFLNYFVSYLKQIQTYCEERDSKFIYIINPSKSTVMRDSLPKGFQFSDEYLEYLKERLKYVGVNFIDNSEVLKEKAKTERLYEKAYDVGHWNDLGMMYGTNSILEVIKETYPTVKLLSKEDFDIKRTNIIHLPLSRILINEKVENWVKKNPGMEEMTGNFEGINIVKSYPYFHVYRLHNGGDLPRVMFFHGSYYNRNPGMYTSSFKEVYGIHNYENLLNFQYFFNIFKPEYVVLETAEYSTNRNFFNLDSLKNEKLSRPLDLMLKLQKPNVTELKGHFDKNVAVILSNQRSKKQKLYSFRLINRGYKSAYISDGVNTYDLINEGDKFTVTVNLDSFNYDAAKVYFFK